MDASLSAYDSGINTEAPTEAPAVVAATPFDLQTIIITRREHVELKTSVAHYKRMHGWATERISFLRSQHQKEIRALIKLRGLSGLLAKNSLTNHIEQFRRGQLSLLIA